MTYQNYLGLCEFHYEMHVKPSKRQKLLFQMQGLGQLT